jgi:hypothetical protein
MAIGISNQQLDKEDNLNERSRESCPIGLQD